MATSSKLLITGPGIMYASSTLTSWNFSTNPFIFIKFAETTLQGFIFPGKKFRRLHGIDSRYVALKVFCGPNNYKIAVYL